MLKFSFIFISLSPKKTEEKQTTTPVSEITTLSLESNTTVSSFHLDSTSSFPSEIISTTTTLPSNSVDDVALKVLPLKITKTNLSDADGGDHKLTVTSSTQTPTTITTSSSIEAKKQENTNTQTDRTSENTTIQPKVILDELDEKTIQNIENERIQEKEGRAINFPLEILSNNQNSSSSSNGRAFPEPINFVTSSTEKNPVMSFFDLSDVSMDNEDHTDNVNNHKTTTEHKIQESTMQPMIVSKENVKQPEMVLKECENNAVMYKVSKNSIFLLQNVLETGILII